MHLSQCTSASKVSLYDDTCHYYPLQWQPRPPMTVLPSLTSLSLSSTSIPSRPLLCSSFPRILGTCHGSPGHKLTILEAFLARSNCLLKTLVILGQSDMLDSNIVDYLLSLPIRSIPEAEIICRDISHRMLKILETYPSTENVFPFIVSWLPNWRHPLSDGRI